MLLEHEKELLLVKKELGSSKREQDRATGSREPG
jgi:hypothetical protein